jgi:hypothetical protein
MVTAACDTIDIFTQQSINNINLFGFGGGRL